MSKRHFLLLLTGLAVISAGSALADNSLDVNANAAIDGNFGLEVLVDGSANSAFVADTSPAAETIYRVEFRANPNGVTMTDGRNHALFMGRQAGGGGNIIRLFMRRNGSNYQVTCRIRVDSGGTAFCGQFTFAPNNTRIGFEWRAADPGLNNGEFRLIKGANIQFERTTYDTDTFVIDTARLGLPQGAAAAGSTGSFFVDTFSSFRTLAAPPGS